MFIVRRNKKQSAHIKSHSSRDKMMADTIMRTAGCYFSQCNFPHIRRILVRGVFYRALNGLFRGKKAQPGRQAGRRSTEKLKRGAGMEANVADC